MILAEEVLPATEWMQKHPDRKDAQHLAAKVSAKHPVEIGTPGAGASGAGGQPDDIDGYLHIEEIKGVEPLDSQFGVHPPKTVPDALYQPRFGQPDPTPAEVAQYGSADKVPVPTIPEMDAEQHFRDCMDAFGIKYVETQLRVARADFAVDFLAPWFEPNREALVVPPGTKITEYTGVSETATVSSGARVIGLRAGTVANRQIAIYDKRAEVIQQNKLGWLTIWNAALKAKGMPPLDLNERGGSAKRCNPRQPHGKNAGTGRAAIRAVYHTRRDF